MGTDGRQDDDLPLKVSHSERPVRQPSESPADVTVLVEDTLELKEGSAQCLAEHHHIVVPLRLDDQAVHLVGEPAVGEAAILEPFGKWLAAFDVCSHHVQERVQAEQSAVCNTLLEVRVLQCVTGIGGGQSHCVGRMFRHDVLQQVEIPFGFRHFLIVDLKHAVAEDSPRPQLRFFLPDGGVIVQAHRQMILDQILRGDSQVHGVPEPELLPHQFQRLVWHLRRRLGTVEKYEVPHVVREILRFDSVGTTFRTVEVATLEDVCDSVVGHVNRAV
mmetsp:Transcript_19778/g.52912  ORF Transcript_19778/g.52912 Transcript_19778/m.52912 type:complete len:274 (+) Transcript_19778:1103-1924(+)